MTAGLALRERMTGSWSADESADVGDLQEYRTAADEGELAGRVIDFELTLASDDVERVMHDLATPMSVTGTASIVGLVDAPVAIGTGTMELVNPDDSVDPTVQHMRYHLPLPGADLHVEGFKVLTRGDLTQLWGAATTLHVTIRRHDIQGSILGRGIARISPSGFAHQLTTLEITNETSELDRMEQLAKFGAAFFGALWDDYGTVVHRSTRLNRHAAPRNHRPLAVPVAEIIGYRTVDGVDLRLTRYRGGDRGPVVLCHGMGANPQTFTADTIAPNIVEFLVGLGFDVWLQEWRGSTSLPTAGTQFNGDQVAQFDHAAAEAKVREVTGRHDVHWVTHCVGSITFMMATLAGWTTPASVVFSQAGAHPVAPTLTKLKTEMRTASLLRVFGVKTLTTDSYDDESIRARVFDFLLRFHPVPRDERCASAVCRRLAFIYGIAVHHAAVNEATHLALHELFGITDLTMMVHLSRCAREERLVTADGANAYLPHVERARLPMTFISGAHNLVWIPESTKRDYDWLVRELGPDGFTRVVLDGHGHQDSFMGAAAFEDAFPVVLAHLERVGC